MLAGGITLGGNGQFNQFGQWCRPAQVITEIEKAQPGAGAMQMDDNKREIVNVKGMVLVFRQAI